MTLLAKKMSRPATPKQIAYLSYMGIRDAPKMSFDEASAAIEDPFTTADQREFERLHDRKSRWISDRLVLHPDLYSAEVQVMLDSELPEALHAYTRSRIVGATEKLTKAKIRSVISSLQKDSPLWWQAQNRDEIFYERLTMAYPSCVDGRPPERKQASPKPAKAKNQPKGSGCLVVLFTLPLGLSVVITYLITKG